MIPTISRTSLGGVLRNPQEQVRQTCLARTSPRF
jgi:hypothetical protein